LTVAVAGWLAAGSVGVGLRWLAGCPPCS